MKNLIYAFSSYLFISYLNLLAAINIVNPHKDNYGIIYDVGFAHLPKIDHIVSHIILFIIYAYFFIKWFITDKEILTEFFNLAAIMYMLRLISFTVTIIPSALPECFCRKSGEDIIWFTTAVESACSDNMFSGHVAHFVLITLLTLLYSNNMFERRVIKILFIPYLLIVIASRMHYSVDVFIATVITTLLFCMKFYGESGHTMIVELLA